MAGRQRGSVIQRGKGKVWYVIVDLPPDPLTPKRRNQKQIRTDARTEKEALRELTRILREIDTGGVLAPATLTLRGYAGQWLAARPQLAPATLRQYEALLRLHILPPLGDHVLGQLTPTLIRRWLTQLRTKALADNTLHAIYKVLSAILEDAVRQEVLARNPAARLAERPTQDGAVRAIWDAEQLLTFLQLIRGERWEALYLVTLGTGLRRGELFGLQWADVDFVKKRLTVKRQQRYVTGGPVLADPKSDNGQRQLQLPRFALDALRRHKAVQDAERLRLGTLWEPTGLVFCKPGGAMQSAFTFDTHWRKFRAAVLVPAGLPALHFHDLRHLHATLGIEAGVDMKTLSQRLGHYSVAFTLGKYGHVTAKMADAAADAYDRAIGDDWDALTEDGDDPDARPGVAADD